MALSNIDQLVQEAYRDREKAWRDAQSQVENWLARRCSELLDGVDLSRLDVAPGRIKDADRTVDKLKRKMAADSDLSIVTAADIEAQIHDLVGVKVLCKSTRDQLLLWDSLQVASGRFTILKQNDYFRNCKDSGYRAGHIVFQVDLGDTAPVAVELQIKTRCQDAWGELTHEDLYKPGSAFKPSPFHHSVARTMANLLAEVDRLADDLATELASSTAQEGARGGEAEAVSAADSGAGTEQSRVRVVVRASGPRYALAVDADGRQGLIPASAVRDLAGVDGLVDVNDYVQVGDELEIEVRENDRGVYFLPIELARVDAASVG